MGQRQGWPLGGVGLGTSLEYRNHTVNTRTDGAASNVNETQQRFALLWGNRERKKKLRAALALVQEAGLGMGCRVSCLRGMVWLWGTGVISRALCAVSRVGVFLGKFFGVTLILW